MRNKAFTVFVVLFLLLNASDPASGRKKDRVIGFYNVENLFDTTHDENKNDYDFLPEGRNEWTEDKYEKKLSNIASVVRGMKERNKVWHTVLGVAEIENSHVLEDLVARPEIAKAGYRFVHYEGPDRRGIDVALLYRPKEFKLLESKAIPFDFDSGIEFEYDEIAKRSFKTRDVLMARGLIDGEMFAIYVAHTPSRVGGKGGDLRGRSCEIIRDDAMRQEKMYPGIKVVVMGDMNDNPSDPSQTEYLHARESMEAVGEGDFFSPFISMHKDGYGTEEFRGEWNIFDIIVVNKALCERQRKSFSIKACEKGIYYGGVFIEPYMVQQTGPYQGTPKRTFSEGRFNDGYSDHYPTYIVVSKKKR